MTAHDRREQITSPRVILAACAGRIFLRWLTVGRRATGIKQSAFIPCRGGRKPYRDHVDPALCAARQFLAVRVFQVVHLGFRYG